MSFLKKFEWRVTFKAKELMFDSRKELGLNLTKTDETTSFRRNDSVTEFWLSFKTLLASIVRVESLLQSRQALKIVPLRPSHNFPSANHQ